MSMIDGKRGKPVKKFIPSKLVDLATYSNKIDQALEDDGKKTGRKEIKSKKGNGERH